MSEETPEWMVYVKPITVKAKTAPEARKYVERFHKVTVAKTYRITDKKDHHPND